MPEEVRKWLASTFAKQEQVIKITMTMMIKIMIVTKYDHDDQSRRGRRNEMSTKYIFLFLQEIQLYYPHKDANEILSGSKINLRSHQPFSTLESKSVSFNLTFHKVFHSEILKALQQLRSL